MNDSLDTIRCYSIRDKVANRFLSPLLYDTDWFAISTFKQLAQTSGNIISDSPNDFSLYYVGTFNTLTGELKRLDVNEWLCDAVQFIEQPKEDNQPDEI